MKRLTVDSGFCRSKKKSIKTIISKNWRSLGPGNEVGWPGFSSAKTFHCEIAHAHQNNKKHLQSWHLGATSVWALSKSKHESSALPIRMHISYIILMHFGTPRRQGYQAILHTRKTMPRPLLLNVLRMFSWPTGLWCAVAAPYIRNSSQHYRTPMEPLAMSGYPAGLFGELIISLYFILYIHYIVQRYCHGLHWKFATADWQAIPSLMSCVSIRYRYHADLLF